MASRKDDLLRRNPVATPEPLSRRNHALWAESVVVDRYAERRGTAALDEIKQLGFDAVEVPVFEIDVPKYAQWGKYLDNAGLARTAVTIRGADDNPMSRDPAIRRKGIDNNKAAAGLRAGRRRRSPRRPVPFGPAAASAGAGPTAR